MVDFRDIPTLYQGLSIAHQSTGSVTPAIAATYNFQGFSFSDGFVPYRTVDPVESDESKTARLVATLIMDLYARTTTHSGT